MKEKYTKLLHAMQTGVGFLMERTASHVSGECSPKHLRVGVNAALIDSGALASLLLKKGIFTEDEYFESLAEYAQGDVDSYTKKLEELTGLKVTLV